jgi:hypothetical protein
LNELEKESGENVITSENYLPESNEVKKLKTEKKKKDIARNK